MSATLHRRLHCPALLLAVAVGPAACGPSAGTFSEGGAETAQGTSGGPTTAPPSWGTTTTSETPTGEYLGQTPPGDQPELFAPGFVTTGLYTRDVAMNPNGSEFYFGVLLGRFNVIMETHRRADGGWTIPEVAPFSRDARFFHLEPAMAPDGSRLMFLSTRVEGREPKPEELRAWVNQDIWVVDREDGGWSEAYNLGPPVNSDESEFFPSLTRDRTLYFTRAGLDGSGSYIYRSRFVDGTYEEPERLGPEVNSTTNQFNAFIAPDESYLIVCTGERDDTLGGTDYYVVFRNLDDTWVGPINMGNTVNTPGDGEFSPYVSPDGQYFFFMSTRPTPDEALPDTLTRNFLLRYRRGPENGNADIYWMNAGFIDRLRPSSR